MISVSDLVFSYGTHPIFDHFSADLPDVAVCTAPNGAGKTTWLKLIAHVLTPQAGAIAIDGKTAYRASLLCHKNLLIDAISIRRQCRWFLHHFDLAPSTFERFQLDDCLEKAPETLSSGQLQWVNVAFALSSRADIALLDEPFRHLDGDKIAVLLQILEERAEAGHKIWVTTHDFPQNCRLPEYPLRTRMASP